MEIATESASSNFEFAQGRIAGANEMLRRIDRVLAEAEPAAQERNEDDSTSTADPFRVRY
jgi:hypothetical protein